MQTGKASGPGGFSSYYKVFLEELTPHFLQAFNSISLHTAMPRDTLGAHISVIPKEGRDLLQCQNYRPISLINVNLKKFSKILASCLAPLLNELIHLDLAGFILRSL